MIRLGRPGDITALLPLIEDFYRIDGHRFDESLVLDALRPLLDSDEHGFVLVAEDGDDLIGYLVMAWSYSLESGGRDALIDEFYVAQRGHGIGTELIDTALRMLIEAGVSRVFLETERDNERVRTLYQRHGFKTEDSVWMSADLAVTT